MESIIAFLEYKTKVIDLLKKKIETRTGRGDVLVEDYQYNGLNFDLAELNESGNPTKVYEIKSRSALKRSPKTSADLLRLYEMEAHTDAYVVFLDARERLQMFSYQDLKDEKLASIKLELTENKLKKVHTIKTFSDFYTTLNDVFDNEQGGYSGLHFFYRGHCYVAFKSVPSIFRNEQYILHENQMYHEAIRKNPSVFTEDMSTFDKLVKMQHYELPTRLLDITTNPLVALYFACQSFKNEDGKECDGAVLIYPMIDEHILYYDDVQVSMLSNLTKCSENFSPGDMKDFMPIIQKEIPSFSDKEYHQSVLSNVYCVMPKINNERIIRQHGAFFIFGMGKTKKDPAKIKDQPITIRIKAESKESILKELQLLGIDEAALFPETDKILKQIKRQYN